MVEKPHVKLVGIVVNTRNIYLLAQFSFLLVTPVPLHTTQGPRAKGSKGGEGESQHLLGRTKDYFDGQSTWAPPLPPSYPCGNLE